MDWCWGPGQQLCDGWYADQESSISGQEKQFPQKRATTTSSAINEVETSFIQIPIYQVLEVLPLVGGSCVSGLAFGARQIGAGR